MTDYIDYSDLIGVKFEYGGRNLNAFDCYGLVMECERRQTGRELPDYRSPEVLQEIASKIAAEKYRWICHAAKTDDGLIPFKELQPGRVIEIRIKGLACHVGYIHRPRYFLHTWEATGGVTEESLDLWRNRILGAYEFQGGELPSRI